MRKKKKEKTKTADEVFRGDQLAHKKQLPAKETLSHRCKLTSMRQRCSQELNSHSFWSFRYIFILRRTFLILFSFTLTSKKKKKHPGMTKKKNFFLALLNSFPNTLQLVFCKSSISQLPPPLWIDAPQNGFRIRSIKISSEGFGQQRN